MIGLLNHILAIIMAFVVIVANGIEDTRGCEEVRELSSIVKDDEAPFDTAYLYVASHKQIWCLATFSCSIV